MPGVSAKGRGGPPLAPGTPLFRVGSSLGTNGLLNAGEVVALPAAARVHAFVATGALLRSSLAEPLAAGDAFWLTGGASYEVTAAIPTELLVWSFGS